MDTEKSLSNQTRAHTKAILRGVKIESICLELNGDKHKEILWMYPNHLSSSTQSSVIQLDEKLWYDYTQLILLNFNFDSSSIKKAE